METSRDGLRMLDKIVLVTGGCDGIGRGCINVFGDRFFNFLCFVYFFLTYYQSATIPSVLVCIKLFHDQQVSDSIIQRGPVIGFELTPDRLSPITSQSIPVNTNGTHVVYWFYSVRESDDSRIH